MKNRLASAFLAAFLLFVLTVRDSAVSGAREDVQAWLNGLGLD